MPAQPVKALATGTNSDQSRPPKELLAQVYSSGMTCSNPSARILLALLILLALNIVACYDAMLTLVFRTVWRIRKTAAGARRALIGLLRPKPTGPSPNVIVGSFPNHKAGRKILIVEDDQVTAFAYAKSLQRAGYEVKVAGTGSAALAQVAAWQPDGVLLDVLLPELNGIQVLTRIHAAAPELPVVICTNIFRPAVEQSALAGGASRIFDKSTVKASELVSEFDRIFEERANTPLAARAA